MKIRNGFVSNSSTSSFCIYGTTIDCSLISDWQDIDPDDLKTDLLVHADGDGDYYIGRKFNQLKDTETGLEFKTRTHQDIINLLQEANYTKDVNCSIINHEYPC
jgi:hypothetical protein